MKYIVAALMLTGFSVTCIHAQDKFFTKAGKISFYSRASLENIEAFNKSTTAVLDTKTGDLQFAVLMKGFEFQKALMQEHFNENYLESDKYPKSAFKGIIINNSDIDYTKDGEYSAKVKGQLTIHGVTNDVETEGKIIAKGGRVSVSSVFNITLQDYKIKNDKMNNIANTIKVLVDCVLEPLKG